MSERLRTRLRGLVQERADRLAAGSPLCYRCDRRTEPGGLAWAAGPGGRDVLVCPRCVTFHNVQKLLCFADPDSPPHAAAVTVLGHVFNSLADALTKRLFELPPRRLTLARAIPCSFCGFDVALHVTGSPGSPRVTVCRACWLLQMSRAFTRYVSASSSVLARVTQQLEECRSLLYTAPFRASRVPPGLTAAEAAEAMMPPGLTAAEAFMDPSLHIPILWLEVGKHIDGGRLPGPARIFSIRNGPADRTDASDAFSPRTDDESEFWLDM